MIRTWDGQGIPWTSLCADPFRVTWCRNPEGGRIGLEESSPLCPVYSPTNKRMGAWESCTENVPGACLELVYRVRLGWLDPIQEAEDVPTVTPSHKLFPSAGPHGMYMAKWLKEDILTGQLDLRRCYWVVELWKIFMAPQVILIWWMPRNTINSITGHTDLLLSGESSMPKIQNVWYN